MDSTTPGQKCVICGKLIPEVEVCPDIVFDEARCDPCVIRWNGLPIATLRSQVSVKGLDWDKISTERKDQLLELQKAWWDYNKGVEKDISGTEKSLLPFKESRIASIKENAEKMRKQMQLEIISLIETIKTEMQKGEVQ